MNGAERSSSPQDITIPESQAIPVDAKDLPVYCPGPLAPLWSMHPRIYIELAKTGRGRCAYCGALYELKEGEKPRGH